MERHVILLKTCIAVAASLNGLLIKTKFRELPIMHRFIPDKCISCLGHVINLAEVAFMSHVTRIAAVETSTAIWEYDPDLPDNRVLHGSLDVIAAVRTLAIKVRLIYQILVNMPTDLSDQCFISTY